jgi:hypothetical protein
MPIRSLSTLLAAGLLAICLPAAGSLAATPPAAEPPTPVSGVVIDSGPAPKLASSFPANGSTVPAGVLVLKIVFNQAMTADGWSYQKAADAAFPDCLGRPRMLADKRTFVLLCTVAPGTAYGIEINAATGFQNANGLSAQSGAVHFTTGDPGVFYMSDALTQAGLAASDGPIMRWPDPDTGKTALAGQPSN